MGEKSKKEIKKEEETSEDKEPDIKNIEENTKNELPNEMPPEPETEEPEFEEESEEGNEVSTLEEIAELLNIDVNKFIKEYEVDPYAWQDKYLTVIQQQKKEAFENMLKSEWVKIENDEVRYMNQASEIFSWLVKFGDYQSLAFKEVENLMMQLKDKRDQALLLESHTNLYGENILKYIKLLSAERVINEAVLEYQNKKIEILENLLLKYYKLTEECKKEVDFDVVST